MVPTITDVPAREAVVQRQPGPAPRRRREGSADERLLRVAAYAGVVFVIFGLGTKQRNLGLGEVRNCPRCGNTTQWTRMREFKQFSLFFVPVARWKRRHLEVCGICGAAIDD